MKWTGWFGMIAVIAPPFMVGIMSQQDGIFSLIVGVFFCLLGGWVFVRRDDAIRQEGYDQGRKDKLWE